MTVQRAATGVRKVTIREVASRAGVSIGTVSLALNGSSRCSDLTVARVRAAAADLNYQPNHAAKSLRRQLSETVALVIPDIGNPVYVAMAKAVQQEAKDRQYHLSLISTDGHPREEIHALETLVRRRVDGMILCSLRMTAPLAQSLRHAPGALWVIGTLPDSVAVDNVRVNSEYGVRLAIDHLVDHGRRRLAFLNGPGNTVPAGVRGRGFAESLRQRDLNATDTPVVHTSFSVSGGYEAVGALLAGHPSIDGVLCANDQIAIGAMKRLRELGRRVPDDIAVVGMDDIPEGMICTPTLTSVSLLARERGQIAARMVLDRLTASTSAEVRTVTVMPRLEVRESSVVAAPRGLGDRP